MGSLQECDLGEAAFRGDAVSLSSTPHPSHASDPWPFGHRTISHHLPLTSYLLVQEDSRVPDEER